ncbi:M23 family metallopeptidase [uncultured Paludibaculum sp.]|uniref:M23 family metallopeptidase n=1 Tax=uncultured Paludibaculum sp. TaxID=1765020 RepID=UPI002AAB6AE6|nr:M23 family metallopeptidase [uncultured Paludibaculum sp.]
MKYALLILLVLLLLGTPATLFFLSSSPVVEVTPTPKGLGVDNQIQVKVTSPHGMRFVTAVLTQGQARSVASKEEPADRWMFWKKHLAPTTQTLHVTAKKEQGFQGGPAKLVVEAASNDLRASSDTKSYDVFVSMEPPRLSVDDLEHIINQGGAELVTFTVSGYYTEAGVIVGNYRFRSFPMPGGKNENDRFCLFAFPWDTPADTRPLVFARNPGGQEVTAPFRVNLHPKKFRQRELDLSDEFLDKAVSEIDPGGTGDKLDRFLRINGEIRKQNNKTLADLRDQTEKRMLWTPPFQQLSNSKVEAFFADVRTYKYNGKKVDQQVHLGFDLSKVKQAPVVASNSGKVIWADRLGIYGNCVVVDHGYGLQSIYGHMSKIDVTKGQMVERGGELGRSGATGLAGGDHLHFSMQIDGVQVNPIEWWDAHWIKDRVLSKLSPPAASSAKPAEGAKEVPEVAPKQAGHTAKKHHKRR